LPDCTDPTSSTTSSAFNASPRNICNRFVLVRLQALPLFFASSHYIIRYGKPIRV
jgi:hypothetical protein